MKGKYRDMLIEALEACARNECAGVACPLFKYGPGKDGKSCFEMLMLAAAQALRDCEPLTAQDKEDLQAIQRVSSGQSHSVVCERYVLFNGPFYRNYARNKGGGR